MKLLLTGGGTSGSVSPLIAIAQKFKEQKPKTKFLWIGTKGGPEESMVADYDIQFKHIQSGKFRRYFDLQNFFDISRIIIGFFQSIFIILKFKPDVILSAGSFISVPVVWAGWLFRKKSLIHQQDVKPGLANKLMAPFATKITVTFEKSLKHFTERKTVWTGNPVREEILRGNRAQALKRFGLENGVPVLLAMGGGTGSITINKIIAESLGELIKFCQIIHLTGARYKIQDTKNKQTSNSNNQNLHDSSLMTHDSHRYHPINFLNVKEMAGAYACADVVVSRCGMSSLTELSVLGKPTIFIPLRGTHQEDNAKLILEKKAGIIIWQKELSKGKLVMEIKNLFDKRDGFLNNINGLIKDGTKGIFKEIEQLVIVK